MTFKLHTIIFLLFWWVGLYAGQNCPSITRRREIRELNQQEVSSFLNAIRQLHSGPAPTRYDQFAQIHLENAPAAHGTELFFVWHREYILQFEEMLKSVDASVTLPYWDWSRDYSNPAGSPVLSSRMMGGNGRRGDNCISSGAFTGFSMFYPEPHCLKRQFDNQSSMSTIFSTVSLLDMIDTSPSYERLNNVIEQLPHARVHVNLGGDDGDMSYMFSTNDPIFFLHHAFVDKIYFEWQQRNSNLARDYPGNADQSMSGFNVTPAQVFSTTGGGRYCYTYNRMNNPSMGNSLSIEMGQTENAQGSSSLTALALNSMVKPLPEAWILRNAQNVENVRQLEEEFGVGKATDEP